MATTKAVAGYSPPVVPYGNEIVMVLVGPGQQKFGAHKDLICASSKYFASAFRGGFTETHSGVIKLPELEPKLFQCFFSDSERQPDELLLDLYLLADYLLTPGMKLLVLEQIRDLFSSHEATIPSNEFTYLLFENDHLKALQQYIVKHISYWLSKSQDRNEWIVLIKVHKKLALEMAVDFTTLETTHVDALKVVHPFRVLNNEIEIGMGLAVLEMEARLNDVQPNEIPDAKVLARAQVLDHFKYLTERPVVGNKRNLEENPDDETATTPPKRVSPRTRNDRPRYR